MVLITLEQLQLLQILEQLPVLPKELIILRQQSERLIMLAP